MTLGAKSSRLTCYNSKLPVPAASSRTAVLTNEKWLKHHAVQQYEAAERLPLFILPNGLQVRHVSNPAEVQFLYNEQYKQQVYLQHQVTLFPGAVVLDVGANIGCFSMYATEAAGPDGRVLSIEPAPATAAALAANMQQHAQWCAAQGKQVARCEVVQAAVGDGRQDQSQLTVFKSAAGWATLMRDDEEVLANMQAYLANVLEGPAAVNGGGGNSNGSTTSTDSNSQGWSPAQQLLVSVARWLNAVPLLRPVSGLMSRLYVQLVMLRNAESVPCQVLTVSQLMDQHSIQRIDLLKIDVERAELQVLQGVAAHHWPAIRQVAMEVHDTRGQLSRVLQLLEHIGGFSCIVAEQDVMLKGTGLYNVYAVRSKLHG